MKHKLLFIILANSSSCSRKNTGGQKFSDAFYMIQFSVGAHTNFSLLPDRPVGKIVGVTAERLNCCACSFEILRFAVCRVCQ